MKTELDEVDEFLAIAEKPRVVPLLSRLPLGAPPCFLSAHLAGFDRDAERELNKPTQEQIEAELIADVHQAQLEAELARAKQAEAKALTPPEPASPEQGGATSPPALARALALAAWFAVFPLAARGKLPLAGSHGAKDATRDPDQLRTLFTKLKARPNANIGIALGAASGVFALDVDPKNGGDEFLADLVAKNGSLPKTVTTITGGIHDGKRGNHFFFRMPERGLTTTYPKRADDTVSGIELRSDGALVVAPTSTHPSGLTYEWAPGCSPSEIEFADAPEWLLALEEAKKRDAFNVTSADSKPSREVTREECVAIVQHLAADGDAAAQNALAGKALWPVGDRNNLMNSYQGALGAREPDATAETWRDIHEKSFAEMDAAKLPDAGGTWGQVFAEQYNRQIGEKRARLREQIANTKALEGVRFDSRPQPASPAEGTFEAAFERARADLAEHQGTGNPIASRRLRFMSGTELVQKKVEETPWLVVGLLARLALAVLSGEPKTSKTWAALTLALAIATGRKAFGEFEVKGGPQHVALFLAEDDEASVRRRLLALLRGMGVTEPAEVSAAMERVHLICRANVNVASDADLSLLLAELRQLPPLALVVLDPLRDVHAEKENDTDAMALVMHKLRALRSVASAAVAFTHHTSKQSTDNRGRRSGQLMRGSSVIHGAIDAGFYMQLAGSNHTNEWTNDVEIEVKGARGAGVFALTLTVEDDRSGLATAARWVFAAKNGDEAKKGEGTTARIERSELQEQIVVLVGAGKYSLAGLKAALKAKGSATKIGQAIDMLLATKRIRYVETRADGSRLPNHEKHYALTKPEAGTPYASQNGGGK